jgi:integrase
VKRRYQNGTVELGKTAAGPTWYIRFTTPPSPGIPSQRPRLRIGLKSQYPTKAKASRAAQQLRDTFNNSPESLCAPLRTFGDLVARYEREEMPERFSTRRGYLKMHRLYIVPRWGATLLSDIEALEVRAWLRSLNHLSTRSKGHLHGQMKNLYKYAALWKWVPATINPMSLFSIAGSTKRTRKPRIVSPAQFRALLKYFADAGGTDGSALRMQLLLTCGFCLGLRASELFGLRWSDFDHLQGIVRIRRAVIQGHVGEVKTERSNAPLPLAEYVGDLFLRWRAASPHSEDEDWVFASPNKGGRKPLDANSLQVRILVPAGAAIGLDFNLGWHTLRHGYKSLLDRISSDASLKRDLMRHADVHTTMQVYGEVEMDRLRAANATAVTLALTE